MRWLWKGWPAPVQPAASRNQVLQQILHPGEGWKVAAEGYATPGGLATDRKGAVRFNDAEKTYVLGADGKAAAIPGPRRGGGQAFGPDGRLYALLQYGKVIATGENGKTATLATDVRGTDLVVAGNGNVYVTDPAGSGSRVWLIRPNGKKQVVDTGLTYASGVTLSPDQTLLYVADGASHWVYSYQIQPDGTLQHKQQYYWLHTPDTREDSNAGGMCVDRNGLLYVATALGVQVCDQAGRVNAILETPGGPVASVAFGGPDGDELYAASAGKVYRRKLAAKGAQAWDTPSKPAPPRL